MDETGRIRRRVRRTIDRPGLRVDLAADVNAVVSRGGSSSSTQHVTIRQGRSATAGPTNQTTDEETP